MAVSDSAPGRILHLLNTAQPGGTGIAKIIATIASHLDPRLRTAAWFLYEDGPLVDELQRAGVDAKFVPWRPSLANPAGPLRLWTECRRERPALIHHHSADWRVRWIVRRAVAAPILLHLHGPAVDETSHPVPLPISTRDADRIIAVSQAVLPYIRASAEVVHTGVETGSPTSDAARDGIVIGTAGRLVAVKAIDLLVRAFALAHEKLPHLRLEIAGDGPDRKRLETQVAQLHLQEAVRFLGWQNPLRPVMRRWAIYVQPSVEEGLGYSMLEAMAEGLPVVATRVGGIPEVVIDAGTGWLVPRSDVDAMAYRIEELARNANLRSHMGVQGRARAMEKFSAEGFVRRIEDIYRQMLGMAADPGGTSLL
ncbi:MAG: glycosyltransferase [Terriglobales bacterium]